jgi:hypothetical protein
MSPSEFYAWSTVAAIAGPKAELYAALFRRKFPRLAAACNGRTEAAAVICATPGACRLGDHPGEYLVLSSRKDRWYTVNTDTRSCTCPDSRADRVCKHRLAIGFHIQGPDWIRLYASDAPAYVSLETVESAYKYMAYALDMCETHADDANRLAFWQKSAADRQAEAEALEDRHQAYMRWLNS